MPVNKGPAFILRNLASGVEGRLYTREDIKLIEAGILAIIFTIPGERPNNPSFGSYVTHMVFEPITPATLSQIDSEVRKAIETWMGDLITLDSFDFIEPEKDQEHSIHYRLFYRINGEYGDARFFDVPFAV